MNQVKKTIKDLGVLTSRNVWFSEHNDDLKFSSKIKPCLLLKAFKTREAESMMKISISTYAINWILVD